MAAGRSRAWCESGGSCGSGAPCDAGMPALSVVPNRFNGLLTVGCGLMARVGRVWPKLVGRLTRGVAVAGDGADARERGVVWGGLRGMGARAGIDVWESTIRQGVCGWQRKRTT